MVEASELEVIAPHAFYGGDARRAAAIDALGQLVPRLGRVLKCPMRGGVLTPQQMMMLKGVQELEGQGGAHPGELAARSYLSSSAVTAALDELVEKGYCVRAHSAVDRRKVLVRLTAQGEASLAVAHRAIAQALHDLLSGLDDQAIERMLPILRDLNTAAATYLDQAKP